MEAHLSPWQPLYPSQRSGALLLESASWNGKPQEFQLQWHEDRVYFRLSHDDSTTWATLDSCTTSDAQSCFHEALERRRHGVCFSHYTHFRYGHQKFLFYLQFIYALDGTGLLREWSSRDWVAFAPKETRAWALFPNEVLPRKDDSGVSRRCCQQAAHSVRDDLLLRRMNEEEFERLSWRSATTKAEFLQIMGWLYNAQIVVPQDDAKRWSGITLTTLSSYIHIRSRINWGNTQWCASQELAQWLENYFMGEGFEWRQTDWGKRRFRKLRTREPHLRAFWEPQGINWRFPFLHCVEPTFHEQLEARLALCDWLRDKAPDFPTDEWMFPQHQP